MAGERALPGLGLFGFWTPNSDGWDIANDQNLRKLSAIVQGGAVSRTVAVPASPADGVIYIVPSGTNANDVAVRDAGAWVYYDAEPGWRFWIEDTGTFAYFNGTAWVDEDAGEVYTFLGLTDVPDSYGAPGQMLIVDALGAGLTFVDPPVGGGGGGGGGIEDAPVDGVGYVRKDAAWVAETIGGGGGGGGFPVTPTLAGPHRFWRLAFTAGNPSFPATATIAVAEIELFETLAGPNIALNAPTGESGRDSGSVGADKAVNGTTNSAGDRWESQTANTTDKSIWISFDLAAPKEVAKVTIWQNSVVPFAPRAGDLQWSDDSLTGPWTNAMSWETPFSGGGYIPMSFETTPGFEGDERPVVGGGGIDFIKALTQAEYDAIPVKSLTTLYVVTG